MPDKFHGSSREDISLRDFGWLEWELLRNDLILTDIIERGELPEGVTGIRVSRGRDYKIKASFTSAPSGSLIPFENDEPGWRIVKGFTIMARHRPAVDVVLTNCVIENVRHNTYTQDGAARQPMVEGSFITSGVHRFTKHRGRPSVLTDWYLNGPGKEFLLPHLTRRKFATTYTRERTGLDAGKVEQTLPQEYYSRDFLRISCGARTFVVHRVPESLGSSWSNNLGFEFRKTWGWMPELEERSAIAEFLSFLLGRHLLHVGSTELDEKHQIREEAATNPWGRSVEATCAGPTYLPIDVSGREGGQRLEKVASELLPSYLERRRDLKTALWLYWIGATMPVGADLPIYYSGLNAMVNARFKEAGGALPDTYIPKVEFVGLIGDLLREARTRLVKHPRGEFVIRNLEQSHLRSGSQRFTFFFEELDLSLGRLERRALKERHKWAHGGTNDVKMIEAIQMTRVYWTLLSRVILRILGYDGAYLDLSGRREVSRPIGEPAGGK